MSEGYAVGHYDPVRHQSGNGHTPSDVLAARAAMEAARHEIGAAVLALRRKAATAVSWRAWVRRDPAVAVGAAFAIGLLWGLLGGRGRA